MTNIVNWEDFEDMWVEECPRCMAAGAETNERNQMILCTLCNGSCYIPHMCEVEDE